jgi:hypothetical protein
MQSCVVLAALLRPRLTTMVAAVAMATLTPSNAIHHRAHWPQCERRIGVRQFSTETMSTDWKNEVKLSKAEANVIWDKGTER